MIGVLVFGLTRLIVGPGGSYPTIVAAVAAARPGDTVEIRGGVYPEGPLFIDRPLSLLGVDRPVIQGSGDYSLIRVTADDVTIAGLTLRHVLSGGMEDRAAIQLASVARARIVDNRIEDAYFGIHVAKSHDCEIRGNRIIGPGGSSQESANAIHLWSSERIAVVGNDVTNHRDGLYLEFVVSSLLTDNVSHGNRRYGMHFMFSDSSVFERNRFQANGVGVAVMYTKRVTMRANQFLDNQGPAAYGLLLKDINDSHILDNVFTRNTYGLHLEGSNRQDVSGNLFSGNGWAVRVLANADDNRFSDNTFIGNAFDVTTNSRTATSRFSGNYWDQYRGYDLDRDGRGDVPFQPVRLFSLVVERNDPALILNRSVFVALLDQAERLLPILTPVALADDAPLMERPAR